MSQKSINHHYVPQGLLKNWYIKNSNHKNQGFWKYQRKYNGEVSLIPKPSSTQSSCSVNHLNTTYRNIFSITQEVIEDSNLIEDKLAKLDSDALVEINKILESPNERILNLQVEEKNILAKFILSLHFRHPETLELSKKMVEKNAADSLEFILQNLEKYNISHHLDLFKKNANLSTMMAKLNDPENYNHIVNMNWLVTVFDTDFFLSGEKPLVLNFSKNEIRPNFGFALSLSPTVLLIGIHPKLFKDDANSFQDFISKFVLDYNGIVCQQSRYAISSKKLDEDIADIYLRALK
ncbi:DUF4238 domain-containing protein [Acinetobacter towneri]|uniref:DUF4238 domain-containing protein n=1 Tax=Acinetobacter towneri TaxID=202956 RepID=UPI00209B46CE|nr:DUF4238 domain-containing protein [Acinetobacter towneri]MCO8056084.1 DUF4238 domain-containing protein [Acinetobacter towneri]